jgi:simple sugar transport system ATP-binding protein
MTDDLVRMEHISKYFGRVQALNDVSIQVRHNEIVGLLGDNGAGKSTLIKILSIDQALMNEVAVRLMKQVGISKNIPPTTPISSLSGGERQAVAIARAMHFDSELIILDEPTNNLGVEETQGVLRFVRSARDRGHSCVFIAHNIYHVFQVVDRIIVLRRGRVVADDIIPSQTTIENVERIITGLDEIAHSA